MRVLALILSQNVTGTIRRRVSLCLWPSHFSNQFALCFWPQRAYSEGNLSSESSDAEKGGGGGGDEGAQAKTLSWRIEKLARGESVASAFQSWMGDGFPVGRGDVFHIINRLRKLKANKRALEVCQFIFNFDLTGLVDRLQLNCLLKCFKEYAQKYEILSGPFCSVFIHSGNFCFVFAYLI